MSDPKPDQSLPDEKQPPRGPGNNRGRSDEAKSKNNETDEERQQREARERRVAREKADAADTSATDD